MLGLWKPFGEALGLYLWPEKKICEKVAKCGLKMGGFGVLGVPLGRMGAPFCGPGQQKERLEVFQKRFWGHPENIDILVCFSHFQRLASPNGTPNDGLELSWGELGTHGGHFWDMWVPVCVKVLA